MAVGMEARVTIIEKSLDRIRQLEDLFGNRANIIFSTQDAVDKYVIRATLSSALLIPAHSRPSWLREICCARCARNQCLSISPSIRALRGNIQGDDA